ncbi:MAG: T9SS type A sorting domain-containing protein [Candidatus Krumholzibacteriota bacterium]|nr:T9SS type A sorting domain-containing protein [Candidatus Krumholzibacteriota bacterium]
MAGSTIEPAGKENVMLATDLKRKKMKKASGSLPREHWKIALPPMTAIIRVAICAGLLLGIWPASVSAIAVDVTEATGSVGDIVTIAITTEDITGEGVYSYESTVTWYASSASATEVVVTGTLTESWGSPTINIQPGGIDIAAAGTLPLAGEGTLVVIRFLLGPGTSNTNLYLDRFVFNEGSPPATLSNGFLTVNALPSTSISPNSGEVAVGDSIPFSTTGGTPPYTYGTTDGLIGDFAGTNYLKGISPGEVYAYSEDDAGISDTTTSPILIRAVKLSAGVEAALAGETILVPVYITDPSDYDIKSAELSISYDDERLTAKGIELSGTLVEAAGWAAPEYNLTDGKITLSMAGVTSLAGPGVLIYIEFTAAYVSYSGSTPLTLSNGMFNEIYPPVHENGSVYITTLPVITVYPDGGNIVAGDILEFYTTGTVTPPLDWGVIDPAVAEIDPSGTFTGLSAGTTRVFVTDDIGATDTTGVITVCGLYVVVEDFTVHTVFPTAIPVSPDRDVTGMGIFGYEMILSFNPMRVEVESVTSIGTMSEGWGAPVINTSTPGEVIVVAAGSVPLEGTLPFFILNLVGIPGSEGTSSSLDISNILFNEGEPCALPVNGSVDIVTGSNGEIPAALDLYQNYPNPFNPATTIRYSLAREGRATLRIFSPSGRLISTLVDRVHQPGILYQVDWNGTNGDGEKVSSGIYFYRLEEGSDSVVRKMLLLR